MVQADDALRRRAQRGTASRAGVNPKALQTSTTYPIPYSVLNLTSSIVNADVNAAAAIAYSKLNLTGSIVNADVNAAAAIAGSKLDLSNVGQAIGNIGDGTNYAEFDSSGRLTLHGNARVCNNLRIIPEMFKLPATNYPARNTSGMFSTLDYDDTTEESAYVDIVLPFGRETGTDMEMSIFWFSDAATTGDCIWGVEYRAIADGDAVAGATTTVEQAFTTNATAGNLNVSTFTTKMLAANIDGKYVIGMRLYRKAADAGDTLVGDARAIGANIEFTSNKLGEPI